MDLKGFNDWVKTQDSGVGIYDAYRHGVQEGAAELRAFQEATGCTTAAELVEKVLAEKKRMGERQVIPKELDVREILLDVVPGDGDGQEIYAKNVQEVEELLSRLGGQLEDRVLQEASRLKNVQDGMSGQVEIWRQRALEWCEKYRKLNGEFQNARECLQDVVTHHNNVMSAFTLMRKHVKDEHSKTYWDHEIKAAFRMKEQANKALKAIPEECDTCEADGIYATDGSGPFDCFKCGKKVKSVKDALSEVVSEIEAMHPEELRELHEANKEGDIAVAMRELNAARDGISATNVLLSDLAALASEVNDHTPDSFTKAVIRLANRANKVLKFPSEGFVKHATVRDADDELNIECRMSDGQKGAFVTVDAQFPELANRIAEFLSSGEATGVQSRPTLRVWLGEMPESNGKTNYTAILHRGDVTRGITIECSEYPDRVRYEADCMRYLIGEIDTEPCILDYNSELHSGYVEPSRTPTYPASAVNAVQSFLIQYRKMRGLDQDQIHCLNNEHPLRPRDLESIIQYTKDALVNSLVA